MVHTICRYCLSDDHSTTCAMMEVTMIAMMTLIISAPATWFANNTR